MRTNIVLDDDLVEEALTLTGAKTKREVVQLALTEMVQRRRRRNLLDLAGKVRLASDYSHKESRKLRG